MEKKLEKYEEIKQKILELGLAIPGTLRETYHRCGKSYCKCMESEEYRHGPYYLWDRKVNGKLGAKSIPEKDVPQYKEWIENRKKLEEFVTEILQYGCYYATKIQDEQKIKKIKKMNRNY